MFAIAWKVVVIAALWTGIAFLLGKLRDLDVMYGTELPSLAQCPAAVAILVGAAGVLCCGVMLSRVGIGTIPGRERLLPTRFLVSGPFRFTRNPMSLAGVTLFVGIALWNRSAFGLGLAAAVFAFMHWLVVRVEEPGLERRFGPSYREYKRHVPRWIPRLKAWHPDQVQGADVETAV